jgi:hypothetical protein
MHRNYEIKKNKRTLEDGFEEDEIKRISLSLRESQIRLLEELTDSNRSKTCRKIIDYFENRAETENNTTGEIYK